MSIMKCPNCGREFSARACKPLVPEHMVPEKRTFDPKLKSLVCPGSGQTPRNAESGVRPLWRDESGHDLD